MYEPTHRTERYTPALFCRVKPNTTSPAQQVSAFTKSVRDLPNRSVFSNVHWESMEMNPKQIEDKTDYVLVFCAGLTYFSVLFQWPVPVVAEAKLLLNCLYEFSVSRPQFDSSISPSVCHS